MKKKSWKLIIFTFIISSIISGCLNLSEDITPPPQNQLPTISQATQPPRPSSTPQNAEAAGQQDDDELESGSVSVNIINQTGSDLAGQILEVRLEAYDQFERVYQEILPLDSLDQVLFDSVPFQSGRFFFASIPYGGAVYRSEIVQVDSETTSLQLEVQLFDTTTRTEGLLIDRVHVLIDFPEPELAQVVEIYIISNLDDATVVAETPGEPSLFFPLPEGAFSIEFDDGSLGQRYLATGEGFADTVSIPPGSGVYQVVVYYNLPYTRSKLDFSQKFDYPVSAVVLMTPAGNIKVKGSDLEDLGQQTISGNTVQVFAAASIPRSGNLEFRVSGKSDSARGQVSGENEKLQPFLIGLGGLGVLMILVGVWLFIRNRQLESDSDFDDREEVLMDSIIALEDLFQKGEISESDFHKKRQELLDQLGKVVKDQKDSS
jgi:hypothetical protein